MNDQADRVLHLLTKTGVDLRPIAPLQPPPAPSSLRSWAYGAAADRLSIYIHEFNGQESLDQAIPTIESAATAAGKEVTFAQNGGFLLAAVFDRSVVDGDSDLERTLDRLLSAFAGEEG